MSDKHNYHQMPDGTVIPPEGVPCVSWVRIGEIKTRTTLVAYNKNDVDPYVTLAGYFTDVELVRKPEYVPLTGDDYSGELLRHTENTRRTLCPACWDNYGILSLWDNRTLIPWEYLAEHYEYKKDGVWQPMRKGMV